MFERGHPLKAGRNTYHDYMCPREDYRGMMIVLVRESNFFAWVQYSRAKKCYDTVSTSYFVENYQCGDFQEISTKFPSYFAHTR